MICYSDIMNLKTDILEKIGQKIIIKGSLGRNKSFEKEATETKGGTPGWYNNAAFDKAAKAAGSMLAATCRSVLFF